MNKKTYVIVAIVVVIILVGVFYGLQVRHKDTLPVQTSNNEKQVTTVPTSKTVPTPPTKSPVTNPTPEPKVTLLQPSPYVNSTSGFSIFLPKNWIAQVKQSSAASSNIWFHDSSDIKEEPDVKIVFGKAERTAEINEAINNLGLDGFVSAVVDGLRSGFNQSNVTSSKKVTINNVLYYQFVITYHGEETSKEATQYTYLTVTDKSYFVIGADAYSDTWSKVSPMILESIATFKLTN